MQHCRPEKHEKQRARASASQRQAKLGAVEALLWNHRLSSGKQWKLKGFFKRHFAFQIVRCLDVRLRDVSLNVTIDRGLRLGVESPGMTPKGSSSKGPSGEKLHKVKIAISLKDSSCCAYETQKTICEDPLRRHPNISYCMQCCMLLFSREHSKILIDMQDSLTALALLSIH